MSTNKIPSCLLFVEVGPEYLGIFGGGFRSFGPYLLFCHVVRRWVGCEYDN